MPMMKKPGMTGGDMDKPGVGKHKMDGVLGRHSFASDADKMVTGDAFPAGKMAADMGTMKISTKKVK